jgi:hypothetical protein
MGSPSTWKISKDQKLRLNKEIIKSDFVDLDDMRMFERELIISNINDPLNENYSIPPLKFHSEGRVICKTSEGKTVSLSVDDPEYISGKMKFLHCGRVTVKDNNGKVLMVDVNDPRYINGELEFLHKGMVTVIDETGRKVKISIFDDRFISGKLKSASKGTVLVTNGNHKFRVNINDPRYVSGEVKFIATGKVCVKDNEGKRFYVDKEDSRLKTGELVGTSKGYWSWRSKISVDNKIYLAIDLARIYNVRVKNLESYLLENKIQYTKIQC